MEKLNISPNEFFNDFEQPKALPNEYLEYRDLLEDMKTPEIKAAILAEYQKAKLYFKKEKPPSVDKEIKPNAANDHFDRNTVRWIVELMKTDHEFQLKAMALAEKYAPGITTKLGEKLFDKEKTG